MLKEDKYYLLQTHVLQLFPSNDKLSNEIQETMTQDLSANVLLNAWIQKSYHLRVKLILFALFFECDQPLSDELKTAKLNSINCDLVEEIFRLTSLPLISFMQDPAIIKKVYREYEHIIYCSYSALINYFAFLGETKKTEVPLSAAFYLMLEANLNKILEFGNRAIQTMEINPCDQEIDISYFASILERNARLLTLLISLCFGSGVRDITTISLEVQGRC